MIRDGIQHLDSKSKHNAAVVKQFYRIIKKRIFTYLSNQNPVRSVRHTEHCTAYNNSRHRIINMAQADFYKTNVNHLWVSIFGECNIHLNCQILQGAIMQASSIKTTFYMNYMPTWTKEHFTVSTAMPHKRDQAP